MQDCWTCAYAERDKHGRFERMCAGYGNCDYEEYTGKVDPTPMQQMQRLHDEAVMSKFISIDACEAYRKAVRDCMAILESE
jgi:hypothetical protein